MNINISSSIVIPTYNGGHLWHASARNISLQKEYVKEVIVIDSSSRDDTAQVSEDNGFKLFEIPSSEFNHGGTRNLGISLTESDVVIFLTQDAIPHENAVKNIIKVFEDLNVAAAFGRQLPHRDANPIAAHARAFNYKSESYISHIDVKHKLGLKTVFISNSFSAYRKSAFEKIGGFPSNTILCEDMYFSAKAILSGFKIAYVAEAEVMHSHNYTAIDEFKRYFDIGVFHQDEAWIRESFGGAGGEGKRFILSELSFLLKNAPLWIPIACINNLSKIVGYKLGQNYKKISPKWRKRLSMHKRYWDNVSD
ncbi:N-glycosyltransferase [Serratia plymuthica]|nr:N-glycosyltransferase [Serratia plymuthica]